MPTFDVTNSREQRHVSSNWHGERQLHDVTYDVSYMVLDKHPKQLVSFASSIGHRPPNESQSSAPDLFYNVSTTDDRLKFGKPKGAVMFSGMGSGHPDGSERNPKDRRNIYLGCGQTTLELVEVDLKYRFARPLSRGTKYCDFSKIPTREQREARAVHGMNLSLNQSGLNLKFSAVDKNTPAVVWRPSSASAHSSSAARRHILLDGCHDGSRVELTKLQKDRPRSAVSSCAANGSNSLQKQQRPSLCPDELSCDASSALSPVGSADYRTTAGNLISAAAGAALSSTSHQLNTTSLSRPSSSCSRNCTAKAFEHLLSAKVAAAAALTSGKGGEVVVGGKEHRAAHRCASPQQRSPPSTLDESIDPLRAFNASRRSVTRPATFSKAKRQGIYDT